MENFKILRPLAWRNIWRNPRRTGITLIVVVVGLWSVLVFASLLAAWGSSSRDAALGLLIGQGQIHADGYMDDPNIEHLMPPANAALIAALNGEGVENWAERLQVPAVVQSEYKTLPITILGVDPAAEARISSVPSKLVMGRNLNGLEDDSVVIGINLAARLKTEIGRRVILMSQGADGLLAQQSFYIVGLYDADQAFEDMYVFTGRSAAQQYLGLENQISQISFTVPQDINLPIVMERIKIAAPDLDARDWRKLSLLLAAMDTSMAAIIYIWLGIMIVLMSIGIINTQLMAVFERIQEFGLMRALGLKPKMVLMLVTMESALLIGIGVLLAMGLAVVTVWSLRNGIDLGAYAAGLEEFQQGQVLFPVIKPSDYLVFPLIIWLMGIIVALWPAYRAQKTSPVEAMRHAK
ncbi:MAG: FtsX-like permease family protein [Rhodobacteraceae bacterium]|nr:FtsX-like permease family protein [Paracoccaceae bacterium]